jgi:hypothetical protein
MMRRAHRRTLPLVVVVVLLLLLIVASVSATRVLPSGETTTTSREEDVASRRAVAVVDDSGKEERGRALQGGGGGGGGGGPDNNNNEDDEPEDVEPDDTTEVDPPKDPCAICDEDVLVLEDVVMPTMEDTTCGMLVLYALTLESESAECGSLRLSETLCCYISPTENPTETPTENPTVTPTESPTENPTVSPTSSPSESPSSSPTISTMPSSAPIPYERSERVDLRYVLWDELSEEQQLAATALYYNQTTWDYVGTNVVEQMHYVGLTEEEKAAALELGYADPESWDCWQNHYENYKWIDLGEQHVQVLQWWEALGWNIYAWNTYEDPPESDGMDWYELSDDERYAAAQLCYTQRTWDSFEALEEEFPMEKPEFRFTDWYAVDDRIRDAADGGLKYSPLSWNVLGLDAVETRAWANLTSYEKESAESIGFAKITWDCWQ